MILNLLLRAARRLAAACPGLDASGGATLHPDGYVVFFDSNGAPSVIMNAEDYLALRNDLDKE